MTNPQVSYIDTQLPGFQWYQFDPYLSGGGNGEINSKTIQGLREHPGTPERFTWGRYFKMKLRGLRECLK